MALDSVLKPGLGRVTLADRLLAGFSRWAIFTLSFVGFCVLVIFALPPGRAESARSARPNVVLIQVDDLAARLLRSKFRSRGGDRLAMPNLVRQVAGQGVEFSRYYSSDPICAPSRASLLSGRSTHNHGMLINASPYGYEHWLNAPEYDSNLATWLQDAGYRTAHVGKFLNGYDANAEVPPGWDRWVTSTKNSGAPYYGAPLNIDGFITEPVGSLRRPDSRNCVIALPSNPRGCKHATDVQTAFAVKEIRDASGSGRPFFLQVDFNAPHDDGVGKSGPKPPPRYQDLIRRVKVAVDLNDSRGNKTKPYFIRNLKPLTPTLKTKIKNRYARELATMRSVDDSIERLLTALRRNNQLENTYVIFLSDNGLFHGEHLIAYGKYLPYEPATRQPLIIRGPGIPRSAKSSVVSSNLDIAATIMQMTSADTAVQTDGVSLLPLARNPRKQEYRAILLEGFDGLELDHPRPFRDGSGRFGLNEALVLNYTGFVAGRWKYIHYYYGDSELYDLYRDPEERQNLARQPKFAFVLEWAEALSGQLRNCEGASCNPVVAPPPR